MDWRMKTLLRIVYLEDDPRDAELVQETLAAGGIECAMTRVETEADFISTLEKGGVDLVLADYTLPSFDGLSALEIVQKNWPSVPLIFVSGTLGEEVAIEALKKGATDYVFKTRLSRLAPSVQRALREAGERSDLIKAEEALQKVQAELAHVTRVTTLGELTASIAHEINQPLSAVVTNANAGLRWLSGESPNIDEAREAIRRILRDGNRAAGVISKTRALFKKAPMTKEQFDINEAVEEIVTLTHSEAQRNRVLVRTRLDGNIPLVLGDRVQLQQVVLNLLINAIEAVSGISEGRREVFVRSQEGRGDAGESRDQNTGHHDPVEAESTHILVAVCDSGRGLDPTALEHLFDAFYTTKPQGLGMGLAISRSIIEAHGGRLWAKANAPQGAIVQFALPIAH
jgi:signal transduction histidine kinase